MRAVGSLMRMHARDLRREARELRQAIKEAERHEQHLEARMEVAIFDAMIAALGSVHKESGPVIDWSAIQRQPAPTPPLTPVSEAVARERLDAYSPGFFARLFGGGKRTRARLEGELASAREADARQAAQHARDHQEAMAGWKDMTDTAQAIVARDPTAYVRALEDLDALEELRALGLQISIAVPHGRRDALRVDLIVEERTIVPQAVKTLTKTGKVSSRPMPKTRSADIYQDYVCGAALRVAREVFAALPIDFVLVNALSDLLDASTGHVRKTPVLSVIAARRTMAGLAFDALDPSEAMSKTIHRMSFKRSEGMRAIDPLTDDDIPATAPAAETATAPLGAAASDRAHIDRPVAARVAPTAIASAFTPPEASPPPRPHQPSWPWWLPRDSNRLSGRYVLGVIAIVILVAILLFGVMSP